MIIFRVNIQATIIYGIYIHYGTKGISSVQLAIDLGITQKTAWFVLHRVREMLKDKAPRMLGENKMVEVDESYVGGREINKHYPKKRSDINPELRNDGTPFKDKKVVIGIIERDGKVVLKHVSGASKKNMVSFIKKHVPEGSKIYTDEYHGYTCLGRWYTHGTVKHALHVYVAGDVNTNSIENFWSILKRGLYGIYHQVSEKHLERYLDEFSAR
ncbi:MAG: IS1595 family transposase, partial [Bacteroidetes bacterium]|nr:IS1595 family transposase [Bacteroidota bacterium]